MITLPLQLQREDGKHAVVNDAHVPVETCCPDMGIDLCKPTTIAMMTDSYSGNSISELSVVAAVLRPC